MRANGERKANRLCAVGIFISGVLTAAACDLRVCCRVCLRIRIHVRVEGEKVIGRLTNCIIFAKQVWSLSANGPCC
jgi:hypothetical protein